MFFLILSAIGFILAAITGYYRLGGWGVIAVIGAGLLFFLVAKSSFHNISGLEKRFMENLNAREVEERRIKPVSSSVRDKLAGYDIHTQPVEVSPDFAYLGKPLREMPFRKHSGINIIKIQRGHINIHIPSGDEPIYPGDILLAVGTTPQLSDFTRMMEEHTAVPREDASEEPNFTVKAGQLGAESFLTGKALRDTDMRKGGCMIISVLHDNKLLTNPGADFCFSEGDTVWIAGEEESCDWFLQ